MKWNSIPEIVATLVVIVILINYRPTQTHNSSGNRVFRFILWFSLLCFGINIVTVIGFEAPHLFSRFSLMALNTAYFFLYPLIPPLFILYLLLYSAEQSPQEHKNRFLVASILIAIVAFVHVVVVFLNINSGLLFSLNEQLEYERGPLNLFPLFAALFYIVTGGVTIIRERQYISPPFLRVMLWLPIISLGIVTIQILLLDVILTGSAIMIALLSVYLNFQTQQISIDNLTKTPNRENFIRHLESLVRKNKKSQIIVVSLDNFKHINDTFDQKVGDQILIAITKFLQQEKFNGTVFRYGGDELALITYHQKISSLGYAILDRFQQPWSVDGISTRLSATLAMLDLPFKSDEQMNPITSLDYAIKKAKSRGVGQVIQCDKTILEELRRKNRLSELLSQATTSGNLSLVFQPVFSLCNGEALFSEALLRFYTKEYGPINPSEFIPLAEELGVIGDLEYWVLRSIAKMLHNLARQGYEMPSVSMNISSRQFMNGTLEHTIGEVLSEYHIPEGKIALELTETTSIGSSFVKVKEMMNRLISKGVSFYLDDFGIGYSNLSYVENLPFKYIKLDKSLIPQNLRSVEAKHFISGIISLVQQMGAKVIVEGIEHSEQLEFLLDQKADLGQGYYLELPLEQSEFITRYTQEGGFSSLVKFSGQLPLNLMSQPE
ncbi:MAG: EAL domain-containing protein [Sphaerochaetaceae bacterium]